MAVPYTFQTATGSIPLSQLDSNFSTAITIGNTAVILGETITTINNLSLANVTISSVASAFPNNYLANSNVIVGTTTLTLGSTVTSINGLSLSNVTISSGNVTISNVTTTNVSATTANISGTANVGTLVVIGNATVGGNVTATGNVTAYKIIPTGSSVTGNGLYLPAANSVGISTNGASAVYIDANQNVGINTTAVTARRVSIGGSMTGSTGAYGLLTAPTIQPDVTVNALLNASQGATAANGGTPYTITNIVAYQAAQGTFNADSTVTNQTGFGVTSTLTGATNNYGFRGQLASATGRFNLYMDGTANNYLAGSLGIGSPTLTQYNLRLSKNITGAATSYGVSVDGTIQSDVTGTAVGYASTIATQAAAFPLTNLVHFYTNGSTIGAGSNVASQFGYYVSNALTGASSNYGFYSLLAAPTSGISTTGTITSISSSTTTVTVNHNAITYTNGQVVTITATANATALTSGATCTILTVGTTDFTLIGAASNTVGVSFTASGVGTGTGTVTLNVQGSGKTVAGAASGSFTYTTTTSQTFAAVTVLTGSVTVSTRYNLYMAGTAQNAFSGDVLIFGAGALGYTTGSGGTTTQLTSRTTGVTLSKTNGAITMFTAVGSTVAATFTVTNTLVAATDTIIVNQKSGTNLYIFLVTAVAAGSFNITFYTTGGIASDAPVINFSVIKAVTA